MRTSIGKRKWMCQPRRLVRSRSIVGTHLPEGAPFLSYVSLCGIGRRSELWIGSQFRGPLLPQRQSGPVESENCPGQRSSRTLCMAVCWLRRSALGPVSQSCHDHMIANGKVGDVLAGCLNHAGGLMAERHRHRVGRSPLMTERSEWHRPAAPILTNSSPRPGGTSSNSATRSGLLCTYGSLTHHAVEDRSTDLHALFPCSDFFG